jgi:hypothetical protein
MFDDFDGREQIECESVVEHRIYEKTGRELAGVATTCPDSGEEVFSFGLSVKSYLRNRALLNEGCSCGNWHYIMECD